MATNLPWFRVYVEILDDRKIAKIARATCSSRAEIIGIWISLLALASQSPERGNLLVTDGIGFDIEDLAEITGMGPDNLNEILKCFETFGMIENSDGVYSILNWVTRQYDSDSSTERVARHRSNQKVNKQKQNNETLQDRYSNGDVTPPDYRLQTTDTELNNSSSSSEKSIVFSVYESEIGVLTPIVAERLQDDIKTFTEGWVIDAIKVASENNIRKLNYVEGVLRAWRVEGRGAAPQGKKPTKAKAESVSDHNAKILEEIANGTY